MKLLLVLTSLLLPSSLFAAENPNIILVMADDMGYGETGYYGHPVLKTPNLDAMAANGLRLDRFYAGASNCSPTRSTVMTGRSNDRTGVFNHGFPLRLQEKVLPSALRTAGYTTGHFGKWHLNGLRGPGVPILKDDTHNPGAFGFDHWLSVTNFFDLDPILSQQGEFQEFKGDSSEVVVAEALKWIGKNAPDENPTFSVIWFGTPHSPFRALEKDKAQFKKLKGNAADHYGELVAMDRSIGTLRAGLKELGIADNTLLWFNSDNGGLPGFTPGTVGELRGFKNSMYEGGLRVPCVIEWPAKIKPRVSSYPACTMDIFPTIAEIVGLPKDAMLDPQDGTSLLPLFTETLTVREKPIPFRHDGRPALIDNNFKLVQPKRDGPYQLYDLQSDPSETTDIVKSNPEIAERLRAQLDAFELAADASVAGKDYPEGEVDPNQPKRQSWTELEAYRPYFEQWEFRPEYRPYLK